jgi:hypothetical protein
MGNLPCAYQNYGCLVGLTPTRVLRLGLTTSKSLKYNDATTCTLVADTNSVYRRYGTCVHNNRFFFTNLLNPVKYTDGTCVRKLGTGTIPAGKYVAVFFDHVVVGYSNYKGTIAPWDVMWSHLHDYNNWTPNTNSEADSYICTEFQTGEEQYPGVTGLLTWKDYCVIYTEGTVYAMFYTGFPRIVHVRPIILDYGNGLPYAVGHLNDTHAFIDTKHENFYALPNSLRMGQPEAFGDPIKDYFFSDLNTDYDLRARTFAYKDREHMEAVWVYVSQASTGAFDKAVAFNWENKTWSTRDVEAEESFCHAGRRAVCANEMIDPASEATYATTPADQTAASGETFGKVWGTRTAQVLREAVPTDLATALVSGPTEPVLETGDYLYGALSVIKELNRILINATASCWDGVKVEVSVRSTIDDPVAWREVGTWTPNAAQRFLTFNGCSGGVVRYRFTGAAVHQAHVRDMIFSAFEEHVSGFGATK